MEYTQYRGVSPSQGGILNTVEETLLQGVYSIQGRIPCSREYTQYSGENPAPGGIFNTREEPCTVSFLNIKEYTLLQGA